MSSNITVDIQPKGGKVQVIWSYSGLYSKTDTGRFTCYIPGFDIYYTVKTEDEVFSRGDQLTHAFFDFYMESLTHNKIKSLATALTRLGFKSGSSYNLSKMLKGEVLRSKFQTSANPVDEEQYSENFAVRGQMSSQLVASC